VENKKYLVFIFLSLFFITNIYADSKKLAYIVSDIKIPFWNIMAKGMENKAEELGYEIEIYSSNNSKKDELKNTITALKKEVSGLIISPINSSTAVTVLNFAQKANTSVVVSDIGTNSGEYVSFISSNNFDGAYNIGKVLANTMEQLKLSKDGTVGIVAIPQKRDNGKARTAGFLKAMDEANIKTAGILQQVDFSYKETYEHSMSLIKNNPNLKALWLQGSDKYQGALNAIKDSGNENKILLICFDAEPEFLDMIQKGTLVGAAMQQPYLMGQKAVESLIEHLEGKTVAKKQHLEVLAISSKNIEEKLPIIKKNVLGIEE
jgi:ribose transport system substrate-binding protein